MLLIDCPHCGPRDEVEFHYGGQAGVGYPRDPQALDDRAWSEYLFVRDSPAGPFAERWAHTAGCRKWFVAVRDTVTYAFLPTGADGAVGADGASGAACAEPTPTDASLPTPTTAEPRGPFRLGPDRSPGHGIDRDRPLALMLDGTALAGLAGDTLASAALASGILTTGPSLYRARPRGIIAAGVEEPNALVEVAPERPGAPHESMLPATTVEAREGLSARSLPGRGVLDPVGDDARYDHRYVHTDVLVVGGGPAGLAAAREASRTGARVLLLDEQPELGGSLLSARAETVDGVPAMDWVRETAAALAAAPETTVLMRTTALGSYDANLVVALERTDPALADRPGVPRQRVWHVRARRVVLATGAHERPLVFADDDRPGVMLAGAVRRYLNRDAVAAGRRVVVATTNDAPYALVEDLHAAGIPVVAVLDARPEPSARAAAVAAATGTEVRCGSTVVGTEADEHGVLTGVVAAALDADGTPSADVEVLDADLLAVSGGHSPVLHLHAHRRGPVRWDAEVAGFVPDGAVPGQEVVGAAAGSPDLAGALAAGARAGHAAAIASGVAAGAAVDPVVPTTAPAEPVGPVRPLWLIADPRHGAGDPLDPARWEDHLVDLQRDRSVADILRATGAGLRSVEHVKRFTSIGTGADQGKTAGVAASGVIGAILQGAEREALGAPDLGAVGFTSHRPPYTPVAFAALAGRRRGDLFDAARRTNAHDAHVELGAVFEDVGQWMRPRYYPRPLPGGGVEDMDAAVARECLAVRGGVGVQDVSTLGKIEIRGADAPEFLNRIYTNGFAKLAVGKGRYGLMCTADGMLFDDGVTLRMAPDRYLMTTTTGGAAKVLEWLEEWLQTEWPELDVVCTSVTEQLSTIAVVGPRSGDLVAELAPGLDVRQSEFGFMEFRYTTLTGGIPARICRISFSGELAFEINVENTFVRAVWDLVLSTGEAQGLDPTPYGTEAMHVLRAEKGLVIIGQDTDGTVTPQDAGMEWAVSTLKDFVGKRSFSRPDTARADRKHLVGVLPVDGRTRLEEGTHLVAAGTPLVDGVVSAADGPVPHLGHVTSSYHSAVLGRPFGLALVQGGRDRIGEVVLGVLEDGTVTEVEIHDPVFYDPEGARRDGDGTDDPEQVRLVPTCSGMVDPETLRRTPAAHLADAMAAGGGERVRLRELEHGTQLGIRAVPGSIGARRIEEVLGAPLPTAHGEVTVADGLSVLWVSPDEFLAVGSGGALGAADLVEQATALLDGEGPESRAPGQVVDLSGNRTILELTGPDARAVLEKSCAVDLHPREFGVGRAVSTLLGTVPVILHRSAEETWRVLPRSSFADYVVRWLLDGMREYVAG